MESIYLGGFAALVIIVIGIVFAKLYVRAPKDLAFVRTGLGGQRVIQDGGALKLPVLHDITWVNLRTLRLEVNRQREAAAAEEKLREVEETDAEGFVHRVPGKQHEPAE